jgi:hypothetical protein
VASLVPAETELLEGEEEEEEEEEEVMLEGGLQAVQEAGYHSGTSRRLQQCEEQPQLR